MKHFDITLWADAARGLASDKDHKQMRAHLDSGCSRCNRWAGSLGRIARLAESETRATPPDSAVRSVRAYFALNQPTRKSWLHEVSLGLTFDSQFEPLTINTRAEEQPKRQLTFGSDDYTLDLTVDPSDGVGDAGIAGYCLRSEGDPVAGVPVFLICRGQFAAQGTTGELGEFEFDAELAEPTELWLFDDNDLPVAVSLDLTQAA